MLSSSISGIHGVSVFCKIEVSLVVFFVLNVVVVREIQRPLVRSSENFQAIHGHRIFSK